MAQGECIVNVQLGARVTMLGLRLAGLLGRLGLMRANFQIMNWSLRQLKIRIGDGQWQYLNRDGHITLKYNG